VLFCYVPITVGRLEIFELSSIEPMVFGDLFTFFPLAPMSPLPPPLSFCCRRKCFLPIVEFYLSGCTASFFPGILLGIGFLGFLACLGLLVFLFFLGSWVGLGRSSGVDSDQKKSCPSKILCPFPLPRFSSDSSLSFFPPCFCKYCIQGRSCLHIR